MSCFCLVLSIWGSSWASRSSFEPAAMEEATISCIDLEEKLNLHDPGAMTEDYIIPRDVVHSLAAAPKSVFYITGDCSLFLHHPDRHLPPPKASSAF